MSGLTACICRMTEWPVFWLPMETPMLSLSLESWIRKSKNSYKTLRLDDITGSGLVEISTYRASARATHAVIRHLAPAISTSPLAGTFLKETLDDRYCRKNIGPTGIEVQARERLRGFRFR